MVFSSQDNSLFQRSVLYSCSQQCLGQGGTSGILLLLLLLALCWQPQDPSFLAWGSHKLTRIHKRVFRGFHPFLELCTPATDWFIVLKYDL